MSKAMRRVTLGFSLVSVPCKVYKATEDHDIHLHQIHKADAGRIRMRRFCSACDTEIPYEDIGMGYELPDRMVPVSEDELNSLPVPDGKVITIDQFADADSLNPLLVNGNHYYLGPDTGGDKGYMLMIQAMAESGRIAVAKVALHKRERFAVIRAVNGILVMNMLSWPDEIRNSEEIPFKATPKPDQAELDLANQLVDAMTKPFDPAQCKDDYAASLSALVEAKTAEKVASGTEVTPKPSQAPNPSMTDQLQAALSAHKSASSTRRSDRRKRT